MKFEWLNKIDWSLFVVGCALVLSAILNGDEPQKKVE